MNHPAAQAGAAFDPATAEHVPRIRRYSARSPRSKPRRIAEDRALIGLEWFLDLGIEKHHGPELTRRIFALRHSLSAYDAAYIAVAELIEAPLLTADGRLSRAHGHRARVELF